MSMAIAEIGTPRPAPAARDDDAAVLRARVDALETRLAEAEAGRAALARLATFPEQNPNLVIEADRHGHVTYVNPVALAALPDLPAAGADHPLLADLPAIVARLERGDLASISREVEVGVAEYEQKICFSGTGDDLVVRVYAHDITARKRAERAIQTLARRVVLAQEEERHRVSRELHDEAGQALTALKISLQIIQADLPPRSKTVRDDLGRAIALVDTTREGIRALAHGLRPPALDTLGLNLTLEDGCRAFAGRTGLAIHYTGDAAVEPPPLPEAVTICFYRCLQEALTNAARHAQATNVTVTLARIAGELRLTVADDGVGFDPRDAGARAGREAGLGLRGMRERLELLGGSLQLDAAPGAGVRLGARLPLGDGR